MSRFSCSVWRRGVRRGQSALVQRVVYAQQQDQQLALVECHGLAPFMLGQWMHMALAGQLDRKSVVEGKRVDLGGRRIIKKKKKTEGQKKDTATHNKSEGSKTANTTTPRRMTQPPQTYPRT